MKDIFKGVAVKIVSVVVITVLVCTGGFVAYRQLAKKMSIEVEHNKVSNLEIIKEKLEATAELNTGSYLCTMVIHETDSKEVKGWKIPLTEKSYIIQYDGIVKAGIKDLTKAELKEDGNTIIVKLPKVEITNVEIDNDSFKLLDQKNNIFNPISIEDTNEAQKEMKEKMSEQAIAKGLLDTAQENAEDIILGILEDAAENCEVKIEWQ